MARISRDDNRLDSPKGLRNNFVPRFESRDRFGRFTEWIAYNVLAPKEYRFDSAALEFTGLTLLLSLQASYAAPLILLAQNRQDDRDRVQIEQDRQRAERNLNDTEYLAREIVSLRLAMQDMASKDFIRAELRSLLEDLDKSKDPAV
jgi:uncharacterized membrane protein